MCDWVCSRCCGTQRVTPSEARRLRAITALTCKVNGRYIYSLDVSRGTSTQVMLQQVVHMHTYMSDFCPTPLCIAQPPPSLHLFSPSPSHVPSSYLLAFVCVHVCLCVCVSVCRGSLFSGWPTSRPPDSCWLSWTTLYVMNNRLEVSVCVCACVFVRVCLRLL